MRQHFVFADQRGGRDLRHHESGVQAGAWRQKRRQTFIQRRIHQSLEPPLADAGQRAQRDRQEVQRKGQRFAVEVSAGDDVALQSVRFESVMKTSGLSTAELIFGLEDLAAVRQGVAHGAMHLRHAAQRVGVLHAAALAMRLANLRCLRACLRRFAAVFICPACGRAL